MRDPGILTSARLLGLSNDSIRIRLGRLVDGTVLPWAEADEPWRAWALSEVPVRVGRIAREDESDPSTAGAVKAAKSRWPVAERIVPLIALRQKKDCWLGRACNPGGQTVQVGYSLDRGFRSSSEDWIRSQLGVAADSCVE